VKTGSKSYIIKRKESNEIIFRNYILVYFMFALGGVTTFSSNSRFVQGFFIFLFFLFLYKKKVFDKGFFFILFFVLIIFIGQLLMFGNFGPIGAISLFYTFFIPYAIIKLVGSKFTDYYINITYVFAIISIFFLVPSYLSQDFRDAVKSFAVWINLDPLQGVKDNFIIYNHELMINGLIKNPGPFYEAGAFGTFLIIALILNLIKIKKILEKKNIIFIIALLTTLSTATYLSLFILLFFYFTQRKSIWINIILAPILFILVFEAFSEVPFLKNKIEAEYEASTRQGDNDERIGRIQGGKVDLQYIGRSPVFGRGLTLPYKGSNNGLTGLALNYGIIGFFLYFYLIIKSLKIYCKANFYDPRFAFFSTISIAAVLLGQVLYSKPIFLGIMMMFILYKRSNMQLYSSNIALSKSNT
jgi:hypothetical protein